MKIRSKKWDSIKSEIKQHKSSFTVYVVLRSLVLITMVLQFFNGNYQNVFLCGLTLLLMIIPSFIQSEFKIELPTTLEIIILLFIFSAEILGEIHSFYLIFPHWDTILHTLNGFLAAGVGFSLVDLLNKDDRLQFHLSPLFMALVAFSFSMTIGVLWEFFEFGADQILGFDTQKDTIIHALHSVELDPTLSNTVVSIEHIKEVAINGNVLNIDGYLDIGLIDTMHDLIVNFIGAFTFSIFGWIYVKKRGKKTFASRFIPFRKKEKGITS